MVSLVSTLSLIFPRQQAIAELSGRISSLHLLTVGSGDAQICDSPHLTLPIRKSDPSQTTGLSAFSTRPLTFS